MQIIAVVTRRMSKMKCAPRNLLVSERVTGSSVPELSCCRCRCRLCTGLRAYNACSLSASSRATVGSRKLSRFLSAEDFNVWLTKSQILDWSWHCVSGGSFFWVGQEYEKDYLIFTDADQNKKFPALILFTYSFTWM